MSERIPARKRRTTRNYRNGNPVRSERFDGAGRGSNRVGLGTEKSIRGDYNRSGAGMGVAYGSKATNASENAYNNRRSETYAKSGKSPTMYP